LDSYSRIERQEVSENIRQFLSALNDDLAKLDFTTRDWAEWDDTFAYINDENQNYVNVNLKDATISRLNIDVMMYVRNDGHLVFCTCFELKERKKTLLIPDLRNHISNSDPLFRFGPNQNSIVGILTTRDGILLVASRKIMSGEGSGPVAGTLVF